MPESPAPPGDPYSRTEYRRLIGWQKRLRRERPFLLELLARAPERSVIDLGCGTGEHVAFFADEGARAVGLDRSESMITAACEHEALGRGRFVLGDALEAAELLADEPPFGLAICLGNMLPYVQEDADLARFAEQAARVLVPGGLLLIQVLNYAGIEASGKRHLPLNFREGDDGEEIVFLRLMTPLGGGRVLFFPTTLTLHPDDEEPVRLRSTRRIELRAWTTDDLPPALEAAGFTVALHGDMVGGPFEPATSNDLVVVAALAP